ncbi:hypothetical protein GCM10009677_15070 [Sphaerisporangium rubeum]
MKPVVGVVTAGVVAVALWGAGARLRGVRGRMGELRVGWTYRVPAGGRVRYAGRRWVSVEGEPWRCGGRCDDVR